MRKRMRRKGAGAIASLLVLLAGVGCGGGGSGAGDTPASGPSPEVYEVHGVLRQLPSGPGRELMIEHEAIPDFRNRAGERVGMAPMTMGFPPAEGLSLEGFAPGDSVVFRFEVRWEGSPPLRLTEIRHLH